MGMKEQLCRECALFKKTDKNAGCLLEQAIAKTPKSNDNTPIRDMIMDAKRLVDCPNADYFLGLIDKASQKSLEQNQGQKPKT